MESFRRISAFMMLMCGAAACLAKTVTDTLTSAAGDRLIVTYDVSQSAGQFTIRFNSVNKKLGTRNREKYKLKEVVPMFFDRTGRYESVKFVGIVPVPFVIPANVSYAWSEDGYFNIQENPTVSLALKADKVSGVISIPVFLTHYEKKGQYNVFGSLGNLDIRLDRQTRSSRQSDKEVVTQMVTSTSETEADNRDITDALSTVERVMGLLAVAEKLPFPENLTFEVMQLRGMRNKVDDAATLRRINDALDAYDAKKLELEENAAADASAAQAKAEQEVLRARQEQQARSDSIAAETQKQAEKSQKRTIWMIVGGAILAVVCFIGNQVFQHFRNISNRRSMQEMQDRMVRQAESEARRRAQSYAHNRAHQARNAARNSARDALNGIKGNRNGTRKDEQKTI